MQRVYEEEDEADEAQDEADEERERQQKEEERVAAAPKPMDQVGTTCRVHACRGCDVSLADLPALDWSAAWRGASAARRRSVMLVGRCDMHIPVSSSAVTVLW